MIRTLVVGMILFVGGVGSFLVFSTESLAQPCRSLETGKTQDCEKSVEEFLEEVRKELASADDDERLAVAENFIFDDFLPNTGIMDKALIDKLTTQVRMMILETRTKNLANDLKSEQHRREMNEALEKLRQQKAASVRYSAVVFSARSAGWATNAATATEAVDLARARCGGSICTRHQVFSSGCAALYQWKGRWFGFGAIPGSSAEDAGRKALDHCQSTHGRKGSKCSIVTAFCQK